mmetsp:Transcript_10498/g.12770  ORF Transcript_10498/g.12770 Transcript_10498/m.12770 type:complete len:169 (+) Transcript_10498:76-582(+)
MKHLIDQIKVFLLVGILSICGLSWFIDPWAPSDSGPRGYLGINFNTGFNLNQICKKIDTKCESKNEKGINSKPEELKGSWDKFLRKANEIAEHKEESNENSECIRGKQKADRCRQMAHNTKEKIQLWCQTEILHQFQCLKDGATQQVCDEGVSNCAKKVAAWNMREFE